MPIRRASMPRSQVASLDIEGWSGGLNSRDDVTRIKDGELSAGKNAYIEPTGAISSRYGRSIYGNMIGNSTKILGLSNFTNAVGTQAQLAVYGTDVYYYNAGVWTSLAQILTTNLPTSGTFFEPTNKYYITNGTDNVVVATSTASVTTDANFKKGKYIVSYENRLLSANISGQENYVWYTDLNADTFTANNYIIVDGAVTGMAVIPSIKAVLIWTKKSLYRLSNFAYDSAVQRSQAPVNLVSGDVGCTAFRTIKEVNGVVYFLGQDSKDVAMVYATNGSTIARVGDKIINDLNGLSSGQLSNSAATSDGFFYRLSVSIGGSVNDSEYVYDTVAKAWQPRWSNGYSCYMTSDISGRKTLYGGDPVTGMVYKLTTTNAYDESFDQQYLSGQDANIAVDGSTAVRASQGFKISVDSGKTLKIAGVVLYLKKNTGTTTDLSVRIETSSAGVPSGTLADANLVGTISAFSGTSYAMYTKMFTTPAEVSGNVLYHLVLKHVTESAGNSQYFWGADASAPTYANGTNSTYTSGTWTSGADDMIFGIITQSEIDFQAETKAFNFGSDSQEKWIDKFYANVSAGGQLTIGMNNMKSASYVSEVVQLDTNGAVWDGGSTWDSGKVWDDSASRKSIWLNSDPSVSRGQYFRVKFSDVGTTAHKIYGLTGFFRKARALA